MKRRKKKPLEAKEVGEKGRDGGRERKRRKKGGNIL